jgi:hypothetical protein
MPVVKKWSSLAALIGLVVLLAMSAHTAVPPSPATSVGSGTIPEIESIRNSTSLPEQSYELTKLLDRVGPAEAQEDMLHSGMPFTGETHLLVHTIGQYIYKKYGLDGLSMCKEYFLSACYHGFIIEVLSNHGMDGVAEALDKCKEAPPAVFAQCAHAAGHGFIAWQDYDLLKGLAMCDELGTKVSNFPSFNCYDGAFMENVWGVHDGQPSPKRWVKPDDIYYPCDDARIPEKYLKACWGNQATLIYQDYHADLKKTALACDGVTNPAYKEMCYNNFARQIHPLTEGDASKALSLCANATGQYWQDYCMLTIVTAAWSVGDRTMPFVLCNQAAGTVRNECMDRLVSMINFDYAQSPADRDQYCGKIEDDTYVNSCKNYPSPSH